MHQMGSDDKRKGSSEVRVNIYKLTSRRYQG